MSKDLMKSDWAVAERLSSAAEPDSRDTSDFLPPQLNSGPGETSAPLDTSALADLEIDVDIDVTPTTDPLRSGALAGGPHMPASPVPAIVPQGWGTGPRPSLTTNEWVKALTDGSSPITFAAASATSTQDQPEPTGQGVPPAPVHVHREGGGVQGAVFRRRRGRRPVREPQSLLTAEAVLPPIPAAPVARSGVTLDDPAEWVPMRGLSPQHVPWADPGDSQWQDPERDPSQTYPAVIRRSGSRSRARKWLLLAAAIGLLAMGVAAGLLI